MHELLKSGGNSVRMVGPKRPVGGSSVSMIGGLSDSTWSGSLTTIPGSSGLYLDWPGPQSRPKVLLVYLMRAWVIARAVISEMTCRV